MAMPASTGRTADQILDKCYDETNEVLKTSAEITLTSNNVELVDSAGNPLANQVVHYLPVKQIENWTIIGAITNTVLTAVYNLAATALKILMVDSSGNALIGQKAMSASLPVAIASNQGAVPVKSPTITWTAFGKTLSGATAEPLMANQAADIVIVKAKSTNAGSMTIAAGTATADNGWECPAATAPPITITGITNMNQVTAIGTPGDKCGGSYGVIS